MKIILEIDTKNDTDVLAAYSVVDAIFALRSEIGKEEKEGGE